MSIKDQIAKHLAANEAEKNQRIEQVARSAQEHAQALEAFRVLRKDQLIPTLQEATSALQERGVAASWTEGEEVELPNKGVKHAFARFAIGEDFVIFECEAHRKTIRVAASRAYANNHVPQLGVEEFLSPLQLTRDRIDAALMATISLVVR
jgi:hypothetical protein